MREGRADHVGNCRQEHSFDSLRSLKQVNSPQHTWQLGDFLTDAVLGAAGESINHILNDLGDELHSFEPSVHRMKEPHKISESLNVNRCVVCKLAIHAHEMDCNRQYKPGRSSFGVSDEKPNRGHWPYIQNKGDVLGL